jgi:hypothetical protein
MEATMTALELFTDDAEQAAQLERDRRAEAAAVNADLRERDADYTPMPVALACLRAALPRALAHAAKLRDPTAPAKIRVLDVGAGAGAWSRAAVSIYQAITGDGRGDLKITAVELDEREHPHLERVADRVIIGDYTTAIRRKGPYAKRPAFDIAIGNPPFSLLRAQDGDVERSMPAQLLEVAPAVALFSRLATWSKDKPGVSVRRKYPPAFVWEVPGSIRFRAPGSRDPKTGKLYGADQHSYAVFLWLRGHTGPTVVDMLPDLTAAERRWVTRPGTEP